MKPKKREVSIFSMSFLDVLSCALGGTLLLLLLMQQVQNESEDDRETPPVADETRLAELEEDLAEQTERAREAEQDADEAKRRERDEQRRRNQAEQERSQAERDAREARQDRDDAERRQGQAERERAEAERERDDAREQLQDNQATKFWVLSIHVTATRGADGQVMDEDFHVNYYIGLNIDGNQVTGQMFGVQDIDKDDGADSFGQARIEGTRDGDQIVFDLIYEGSADGDIERVTASFTDDSHMEGNLSSVTSTEGHRGYEGPLTGTRLTP